MPWDRETRNSLYRLACESMILSLLYVGSTFQSSSSSQVCEHKPLRRHVCSSKAIIFVRAAWWPYIATRYRIGMLPAQAS